MTKKIFVAGHNSNVVHSILQSINQGIQYEVVRLDEDIKKFKEINGRCPYESEKQLIKQYGLRSVQGMIQTINPKLEHSIESFKSSIEIAYNKLKEPWIDPNEPVFNHHKHVQTCIKNRKNRKKRKRKNK